MHEMGIAQQIMNVVMQSLPPDAPDIQIRAINLTLGKLTAIVPQSLSFCMQVITKDTPLEGATLNINEIPFRALCKDCGKESEIADLPFQCRHCEGTNLEPLSGRELIVDSIEVED